MNDLTVIYYTSNQESPKFAERIRRTIAHMSRPAPIISVSQKPIDFGQNICVGEVGICGHNALMQLLHGVIEAKTKYVCTAESDFIYPREYFQFRPPKDDVLYFADPIYVLFAQRRASKVFVRKPKKSGFAMVANRCHLLGIMGELFFNKPVWAKEDTKGDLKNFYDVYKFDFFEVETPLVSFKTDQGMHRATPYLKGSMTRELPGIGDSQKLIRRYMR